MEITRKSTRHGLTTRDTNSISLTASADPLTDADLQAIVETDRDFQEMPKIDQITEFATKALADAGLPTEYDPQVLEQADRYSLTWFAANILRHVAAGRLAETAGNTQVAIEWSLGLSEVFMQMEIN